MTTILGALAPIFLLILLGWSFRVSGFLTDGFWVPAEKLTYFFLFPALLIANLAEARLEGLPVAGMVGAHGIGTLVMAAVAASLALIAAKPPLRLNGPGFSSLFQGLIRPNTYVGFAATAGLFGASGVTLTAICVALVVPLVNLLSVIALVRWGGSKEGAQRGIGAALLAIVKNPLIAACLIGIALNLFDIGLPPVIGPFLKVLGQASLALGLLAVGAGLEVAAIRQSGPAVGLAAFGKLLALPALIGGCAWMLGVRDLALAVTIAYAGLPVAPNAYVLARRMGGDARLMAAMITLTTVLAAATLPAWMLLITGGLP